ncbi:3'-5' exoribonuclease [Ligilactobacillus sp. WC1T17]|uniref:3'-5' exoribonuclease n=1 Tax=Ligilactobacillus ruminis TaxID=1623 RepID=A0ABY1A9S5_9LACO|nr:3'-5' exoribonuclease [Ligilactobacillus ruminis]
MAKQLFDYEVGEQVDLFALIKSADVRTAKNGNHFIALKFADKSGTISAKFWDASDKEIKLFQPGKVVYLNGKRETYQNNPQIKISHLRLAKDDEPNNPSLYLQDAPEDQSQMQVELQTFISQIKNKTWHDVVLALVTKYQEAFFTYPAAKSNHHAYAGGLIYHTLTILKLAQGVAKVYPVNTSLLYAGAILHDMGKLKELSGAVATTYTMEGNLLGHIVLIDEEVVLTMQKLGIDLDSEDAVLLRHMIISHHGLLEYGSPQTPKLLEADILHQLDNLDASVQMIRAAVGHTQEGQFTEKLFALDGRMFYHPQD